MYVHAIAAQHPTQSFTTSTSRYFRDSYFLSSLWPGVRSHFATQSVGYVLKYFQQHFEAHLENVLEINPFPFFCIKPFLLHRIKMFWRKFRQVKEVTIAKLLPRPPPCHICHFCESASYTQVHAVLTQDASALDINMGGSMGVGDDLL